MINKIKLAVVGLVLSLGTITNLSAQKVAHIDLDSLISLLPESKAAQESVQDYAKQLEQQVIAMQSELQTKYTEYQEKAKDLPELVRASKEKELNDLNQRIQDFQQQAQVDYQKKSAEISKPIYEKAKKAIDQVAKENAYKYVLDTSTGLVLYSEPTDDIMALVIKKMGVPATAPAPTASPVKK